MREINSNYEPDEIEYYSRQPKRKLKRPGRFCVFIITFLICIWMVFSFIVSLGTGQKFSIFGVSSHPVRNIVVAFYPNCAELAESLSKLHFFGIFEIVIDQLLQGLNQRFFAFAELSAGRNLIADF